MLQRAGFDPNSHSGKALMHILEEYPRDELFQVDVDTLYNFVMEILILYERPRVRALARVDKFDRFVSILAFIPREKYDTNVRTRVAAFLAQAYKGTLSASYVSFPEGSLARVHYIIGRYEGKTPAVERAMLEAGISAIAATWADKLKAALTASTDGMRARMLANRYVRAFSGGYTEVFTAEQAIADITTIEKLTPARPVTISVHRFEGEDDPRRFGLKVFSDAAPLSLSYRVPVIENHGLRVVNERTYQIVPGNMPEPVWLHDMTIETSDGQPIEIKPGIQPSPGSLDHGGGHRSRRIRWIQRPDPAHRPELAGSLDHPGAVPLPAPDPRSVQPGLYVGDVAQERRDHRQHGRAVPVPPRSAPRPHRCRALGTRDGPACRDRGAAQIRRLARRRPHPAPFRQSGAGNHPHQSVADRRGWTSASGDLLQVRRARIDDLPAPRPLYEIFVYSPRVEGIHLRFGKVARGGLRWSDRPQDFRTEILGLVKAQQVKNAVIVPVGAKGGFVPKRLPPPSNRDAWMAEGTEAYRIFVRSLLELTDNLDGDDSRAARLYRAP